MIKYSNKRRAREIFNNARHPLIVIEAVDFKQSTTNSICGLYGSIEPVAVVVCSPDGIYALDMAAKLTSLDQLRQDTPGLDAMIAPILEAKKCFQTEAM